MRNQRLPEPFRSLLNAASPHVPEERKIRTDYWRKPGPTDQFDWSASFDDDEPDDNGNMKVGYGRTEAEAIEDLKEIAENDA